MNFRELGRIFSLLILVDLALATSRNYSDRDVTFTVAQELKSGIKGYVFLRGSPDYETARPVHNGACRFIFPLLIVKPLTTEDVAFTVRTARKYGIELSVRSGGHSYQCTGTKTDSIHLDMRRLNDIEFLPPYKTVRFGTGVTMKDVVNVVKQDKFTIIHGNALNVGAGGYLLGGGMNPLGTTHRYGFGGDHVLEYKMVLADGSIAKVNDYATTIINRDGYDVHEVHPHTEDTNLRFALRRAGASFGIATEFVYEVFQHPETLAVVALTYITSGRDLEKLIRAGQDGRYGVTITQPMFFRKPKPSHLIAWAFIRVPGFLKWKDGAPVQPTAVAVVDLKSNNGKTDPSQAFAFLQSYGINVVMANEGFMETFGFDKVNLSVDEQEQVYMTEDELKAEGYHSMTSANANGFRSFKAVEDIFLHHPNFGMFSRNVPNGKFVCDFCVWILYIAKPGVFESVMIDTEIGPLYAGLDCTFNPNDPVKVKYCPKEVKNVQKKMFYNAKKYGEDLYQYSNTPGCDDTFRPFGERYWGNIYPRLLKIKHHWDPHNVFNYCHSVGSTQEQCCVT